MADMTDQPARGPDGQLLDASKMTWHYDPDDTHPIQPIEPSDPTSSVQGAAFDLSHFDMY
jgi:hypothetical protein